MKKYDTITIDRTLLENNKYADVIIQKYTSAENHPEHKCVAIVDFVVRKLIYADKPDEISRLINKELKENHEGSDDL